MPRELQLFSDSTATTPVRTMDFGRPFTGTKNQATLYAKNLHPKWRIDNIQYLHSEEGLDVVVPSSLEPLEVKPVKIFWNPNVARDDPLDIGKFMTGDLMIG